MKTLATHPDLVRAWLLALAGMPLPQTPPPALPPLDGSRKAPASPAYRFM